MGALISKKKVTQKVTGIDTRLLGSLPHLSALPLQPPHSLLLPLKLFINYN